MYIKQYCYVDMCCFLLIGPTFSCVRDVSQSYFYLKSTRLKNQSLQQRKLVLKRYDQTVCLVFMSVTRLLYDNHFHKKKPSLVSTRRHTTIFNSIQNIAKHATLKKQQYKYK